MQSDREVAGWSYQQAAQWAVARGLAGGTVSLSSNAMHRTTIGLWLPYGCEGLLGPLDTRNDLASVSVTWGGTAVGSSTRPKSERCRPTLILANGRLSHGHAPDQLAEPYLGQDCCGVEDEAEVRQVRALA